MGVIEDDQAIADLVLEQIATKFGFTTKRDFYVIALVLAAKRIKDNDKKEITQTSKDAKK